MLIGFECFPAGVSPRRYATKVYDHIKSDGSLIKLDTISYLIKEGFFNLSTMLNLKNPMDASHAETSKPEHTKINKGNMHLYDQAKLKERKI